MNEEDQKHDQTPEPEQNESSVSCTSLTLSAPTVTFEEVISENKLWHLFGKVRGKTHTRDDAR